MSKKRKPRSFKVWVVSTKDDWVYVEKNRAEALRSINRPAGESVEEAVLTLSPGTPWSK